MPMTAVARRLLPFLAALTALTVISLAGIATAAQTGVGAQTRVWALNPMGKADARVIGSESACTHPGSAAARAELAPGFCVARRRRSRWAGADRRWI